MNTEFDKRIKSYRKVLKGIGILEIVGGITGILAIIWLGLQGISTNTYVLLILLLAIGLYIYSITAGIKLFKYQEGNVLHSQILQILQIIAISISGYTYLFNSGANLSIGYNFLSSDLKLNASIISSEFEFNIATNDQNEFVYINLFAIAVLLLIDKSVIVIKEQLKQKEKYEQDSIENLGKEDI